MTSTPRREVVVEGLLGEPLRPAQDRRERVVQLVRDAGDRLAERRHLFGLQQLLVQVARLVVELLPLADVADERFDPAARRCRPAPLARSLRPTPPMPSTRRMRSR